MHEETSGYGLCSITYSIPADMSLFVEFKRHPGSTWIVKPTNRSQGKESF